MFLITLKEGKDKAPRRRHPWVFSGAIDRIEGEEGGNGWAEAISADGSFIAYGWYDGKSHIPLRLMSWEKSDEMGEMFIRKLVHSSIRRRMEFFSLSDTTAFRLIHGEADFLPGVAADAYGTEIRIIISSRFADRFLSVIASELDTLLHPSIIEAVTDRQFSSLEAIPERIVRYIGGNETTEGQDRMNARFMERGIWFEAVPGRGQKSGFYCDQRENRNAIERYAAGKAVLDLFSYTGGFTLHALKAGALSVDAVDSSEAALRHLLYQVHLNEEKGTIPLLSREKVSTEQANAFDWIRNAPEGKYGLMILDPPKLARSKGTLESAMKAYKDLNRVAMTKAPDNGIIATFSCSGAMSREDFRMMLGWAASDAHCDVQILETLSAGPDHPIRLSFPESEYLKGFIIRVMR